MKQIKKGKKLLAIALSVLLAAGSLPTMAFAEGRAQSKSEEGTCQHHLEHTADCGYEKGTPCKHSHTENCFTDELICGYIVSEDEITDEETDTAATGSNWNHEHTQECFLMDCPHERGEHEVNDGLNRDDSCGYTEAHACGYICELCGQPDNIPDKKPADEAEQTGCSLTEGCTLSEGHEGECVTEQLPADAALVKTITGWTFVGDDNLNEGVLPLSNVSMEQQADFDMVVSMLPTGILAEVEGETNSVPVDITGWDCPEYEKDASGNWPVTGEYVFMAVLPEGYTCDMAPVVTVLMGGAEIYASTTTTVGDFQITGDPSGYDFTNPDTNPELVIHDGATLTIQNTNFETSTIHTIKVDEGATGVNITLAGVNINVQSPNPPVGRSACAFDMTGATVNLILAESSKNILNSGPAFAGVQVPEGARLTIGGSGTLESMSNGSGAGIGGSNGGNGGTVIIQGGANVTAAGSYGAGIGGGNGGTITIQGGSNVTAASNSGAGIGGGHDGNGGTITIQGGVNVTATSNSGAGIGGGHGNGGDGGTIIIKDSAQVKATSNNGAGIGGGFYSGFGKGNGGNVEISGQNTNVIAKGSDQGFDVGGHTSGSNGGSLSVTSGATLEMQGMGTNSEHQSYKNCTIIDKNGNSTEYNGAGNPIASPTLSLSVAPAGSLALPGDIELTATLSGTSGSTAGRPITFTVGGVTYPAVMTNGSGEATHTITSPSPGAYTFGASFAGDDDNKQAAATPINNYVVSLGEQEALMIKGLNNTYTYGDEPFNLSTSGGTTGGAVGYTSNSPSVASVTGSRVTIHSAGTFTITATMEGNDNYAEATVTSDTVTVTPATPYVSLTATGGTDINDPIVLTATVSAVKTGATPPTGTVTFSEGNQTLKDNIALNGSGEATHTVSTLTAGNHTYTVSYSGQNGYYDSSSTDLTVGVGFANQTGFTVRDPGTKTYGDGDFDLKTDGGESKGDVSFSVPDNNGVLTVAADGKVTIIGVGKVTITATKAGDSNYNPATATLDITVVPRDIANVTVNVTGSRVYTGSPLQPIFAVSDGGIAINTGDYINEYGPNVVAGAGAGSIKLTGQHNYTGTKTVAFDIEQRALTGAVITLEAGPYTYKGSAVTPKVTGVVVDGITVPADAFDVHYSNNTGVGTATATITAKTDSNFSGFAGTSFEITRYRGGGSSSGSSGSSSSSAPKSSYTVTGNSTSQSISRSDLSKLADGSRLLTIQSDATKILLSPAALRAILAAVPETADSIIFSAVPADLSAYPDAAALIGAHPVYDFTISYKDAQGTSVSVKVDFPAGSVSIALNYAPASTEVTGNLFMVYVDGSGAVTWLDKSSYNNGKVLAEIPHFSVYGAAYKAPAAAFTDISGHWAQADMEFAAARGLLSGTGNGTFSPDAPMTRGMFVTALGRLAGVNPGTYPTRSFADVAADAYYAPYAEWAVQRNIAGATGENSFSPDAPVTREQMAVILSGYAGQMGYSIPAPLTAAPFADNSSISEGAAGDVAALQRAGIIRSKNGSRFEPQSSATRADGSAVLRRFVETVMDSSTVNGWLRNDSGQWFYYRNGVMAVNTTVDGYEIGPDGVMKEQ